MPTISRKSCVIVLMLALMIGASVSVKAQSFGGDRRSTGEKAAIIAGGAAAGALLGGLVKGGKGALVGGLLGGGAGSAYVYIQGRREQDRYRYYGDRRYYGEGYYRDGYGAHGGTRYDRYHEYRGDHGWDGDHEGR